jgi:flagellin-like hook-associated protein FlgL
VTLGAEEAFGAVSGRVKGNRDLDPTMTGATRLADLNGARNLGIGLGTVTANVGATEVQIDLTTAHTVQDVIDLLNAGIQAVDAPATVAIDPLTDNRLQISGNTVVINIFDEGGPATAADLGIDQSFAIGGPTAGSDVDPSLTELTPLAGLSGITVPMGTIRIENAGQTRDLDLSGATTVQDVMNAVEGLDLGVRVVIAESGDRLDFLNELSGASMSIGEVAASPVQTATELGVRSLDLTTRLADLNRGRGVQILPDAVDPVTGLPDPDRSTDFRITLASNVSFDVDLEGAETIDDVIAAILGAAAAEGVGGADFQVDLVADGNGIQLTDTSPPAGGTFALTPLNGSFAAEDLGLTVTPAGGVILGDDRATVAVESVFTHLMDLREALRSDDGRGIVFAGERFEADIVRLSEARARAGVNGRQIETAVTREEDLRIQDVALKSQFQDLDLTEAAIRFASLPQQLQAGLATAAQLHSMSLLDFLT